MNIKWNYVRSAILSIAWSYLFLSKGFEVTALAVIITFACIYLVGQVHKYIGVNEQGKQSS